MPTDDVVVRLRLDQLLIVVIIISMSQSELDSIEREVMDHPESPHPEHRVGSLTKSRITIHIAPSDVEVKILKQTECPCISHIAGMQQSDDALLPESGDRLFYVSLIVVGIGNEPYLHASMCKVRRLWDAKIEHFGIDFVHGGHQRILVDATDFDDECTVMTLLIAVKGPERYNIAPDVGDGTRDPA